MKLSEKQRKHLRGLGHALQPVVLIGNAGLSEGVIAETSRALHDHELVKIKARGGDRDARDQVFAELERRTGSALVQRIGHVGLLYKPHPELPKLVIPDA